MSLEPKYHANEADYAKTREVDAGLQAHMQGVYRKMCLGLIVTGAIAFAVANTPVLFNLVFGTPLIWVAMLAPLAIVWFGFSPRKMQTKSTGYVTGMFLLVAGLFGLSFASIFHAFSGESIARVFFITSGMFAAMSLYGYTTKKDLTSMGSFLFMGLIGIIIAMVVNLFIQSEAVHFAISVIGVIVFTGLTAWDTQRIKESYHVSFGSEANAKAATMGALGLYLNFINLFMMLLHLMGNQD